MTHRPGGAHRPRIRPLAAAVLLAAAFCLPAIVRPPVVHAAACTGWSSTTTPPPTIRVYRSSGPAAGTVQTVDFETYVKVVMPAEWPQSWSMEALRAGAVAIKQYAWYYTMHWRGGSGPGGCFDVVDNNNDQVYKPETETPAASHISAVESTWAESITKNGTFVFTGYRPGTNVACGADAHTAGGNYLMQRSALNCARAGQTGEEILQIYYGPGLVIRGAPGLPGAPTAVTAAGSDSSATVSWSAPASDGGSAITGFTVTSAPGGMTCATTGALSCAVGGLTNGTPYTFTVTATNTVGTGLPSAPSNSVTPEAGGGPPSQPITIGGATYHPMTPTRVLDTRNGTGLSGKLVANTPATFAVAGVGGIPANATAVTGNVTVADETAGWAVYLGPVPAANPPTSTVNFLAGQITGNGLTVALGSGGTLSATYISNPGNKTDLVFDVTGYFTPDASGATYHPMTPVRLLDTRNGTGLSGKLSANTPATFVVAGVGGVPSNAVAVSGNLTVANETAAWAVYLGPAPVAAPTSSAINFTKGQIKGNSLTVALGPGGTLSATYMSNPGNKTDLVFDVTGFYTPDSTGSVYVPLAPARVLDTRTGTGISGKLSANTPAAFAVAGAGGVPSAATGVTGNVTVVNETAGWAVYLGPAPIANPPTSTINFTVGQIAGNGVTVALGSGGTLSATYMSNPGNRTDLVFDVSGYYAP